MISKDIGSNHLSLVEAIKDIHWMRIAAFPATFAQVIVNSMIVVFESEIYQSVYAICLIYFGVLIENLVKLDERGKKNAEKTKNYSKNAI